MVEYIKLTVGCFAIQFTVAVAVPSFPALSTNLNVKLPFSSNVYVSLPSLFVIVTSSLGTNVTVTDSSVKSIVLNVNSAVGSSLSIQSTVIVLVPTFPKPSTNSSS